MNTLATYTVRGPMKPQQSRNPGRGFFVQTPYSELGEAPGKGEWQALCGGEYPMDSDLPLLDQDRIARAAEGMISNYGKDALAEAVRRVKTLRSTGCDAAASTWESVCKMIQVRMAG
jgi:hypothetical protein